MKTKTISIMLSLIIIVFILPGCSDNNSIVKEIDSPNGNYVAIAFIRDLGATTPYSPQVSLLRKGSKLGNNAGNIFIGNKSKIIDVVWEDDSTLRVIYNCSDQDIFLQEKEKYGIDIIYTKLTD